MCHGLLRSLRYGQDYFWRGFAGVRLAGCFRCGRLLHLLGLLAARLGNFGMNTKDLSKLVTEQNNPASAAIDKLPTARIIEIINDQDATVAAAVRREIPQIARAVDLIVGALESGGRLFFVGAGTSGRLGCLDASE